MKNHTLNKSIQQFLKSELRFLFIILSGISIWALVSIYFGYKTPDDFLSWAYILGLVIAYPFASFLNRRYLKL